MVTITAYKVREREDGTEFCIINLQGGIEMVKSQKTGNFYATAKSAVIPSTFDENTCKGLLGSQMEGGIIKQECEPYDYTVKGTGEIITLKHRYVYVTKQELNNQNKTTVKESVFKANNILEPIM